MLFRSPVKKNAKGELPNQAELLEQAHSQKFIRFNESETKDHSSHEGGIQKAIFYQSLDKILLLEIKSHILKFAGSDLKKKDQIDLHSKEVDLYMAQDSEEDKGRLEKLRSEKYFVLSTAYNEKDEILACVCSNKTVHLLGKYKNTFKRIKFIYTNGVQYGIWYMERHKLWITASRHYEKIPEIGRAHV